LIANGGGAARYTQHGGVMPASDHDARVSGRLTALPKVLGGFELVARLGQGGMGEVWKARQLSMQRLVALKVLRCEYAHDRRFIERFQREARACARIEHPNIVRGIDVGCDTDSGLWYFAMELIDGPSLKQELARTGRLPAARVLGIVRDVALALDHAHRAGVVHRDVKPDNILLTAEGHPKLADLGLARRMDEASAKIARQRAAGTPLYMAPEQIRGGETPIDGRADIYALGATAYHLIAGVPPLKGDDALDTLRLHLKEVPRRLDLVVPIDGAVAGLIERMLAKDPALRPQDAAEVARLARDLLRPRVPPRRRLPAPHWLGRRVLAVLSVLLVGLAVTAWALHRGGAAATVQAGHSLAEPLLSAPVSGLSPAPSAPPAKPPLPAPTPPPVQPAPPVPVAAVDRYEVIAASMTYARAVAACAERGGRLAQPRTGAEVEQIAALVRKAGDDCWIGLAYQPSDKTWRWGDGSSPGAEDLPWDVGQPDQVGQRPVMVRVRRNGKWADARPERSYFAICEIPAKRP
jgi:serine/threonine-protein kinase